MSDAMTDLRNWTPRPAPELQSAQGRFVRIDPVRWPDDAGDLFAAVGGRENAGLWRYIPIGPFWDAAVMSETLAGVAREDFWKTHVIRDVRTGAVLGMASYMRIRPEAGSVEIGCIVYSKALQRTPAATEAMYLMGRYVFALGYRRYEWKCNNANTASKRAAERLGFVFEGVFRQDMVMKGENRDTAWFSIIDTEWPKTKAAFEAWLAPENFDADGAQRVSLANIRAAT